MSGDFEHGLFFERPDRDHQMTPYFELFLEGGWNAGRGGRDQNSIKGGKGGKAQTTIANKEFGTTIQVF